MKPVALWWQQPKACLQLPGLAESPPGPPSWVSVLKLVSPTTHRKH